MLYRFKSRAAADVIMVSPAAEQMLALLGKIPAAQGIVEVDALPAAIAALESESAALIPAEAAAAEPAEGSDDDVSLRQRLRPMRELLQAALAADMPVVWGV